MHEFKIIANTIDFMEANGATAKVVTFAVDQQLADEINAKYGTTYSVRDMEKAVDKCVANELVTHRALDEKYKYLGVATKGIGAARSRARAEEIKASRTWIKQASDYIETARAYLWSSASLWLSPRLILISLESINGKQRISYHVEMPALWLCPEGRHREEISIWRHAQVRRMWQAKRL